MLKKRIVVIIISIGPILFLNAQFNQFNLSNYKLPEIDRKALETNFNLSSSNNIYKYYSLSEYYNSPSKISSKSKNFNSNINYSHFINNGSYQRETFSGLSFLYSSNNRLIDKQTDIEQKYINSYFYYSRINRKYFMSNYFFQLDMDFDYLYEKSKDKGSDNTSSAYDINVATHSLSMIVPLKIGRGRIEPIQDARHAIYIVEELSKVDRFPSKITDEEIIEFAEFISKLKNKRFFDYRIRKIEEIEAIDSFLMDKNYLSTVDAKYFTILNDIWDYGNRPYRNSGTRLSLAAYPGYYLLDNYQETDEIYNNTNGSNTKVLGIDLGFEFRYEKPINLYWQNTINFDGYFGVLNGKQKIVPNFKGKINIPYIQFEFSNDIGYYPNTRSSFTCGYSAKFLEMFDKSDDDNEIYGLKGKAAMIEAYLSVNYYFSQQLRISASTNFYYIWQDSNNDSYINLENISKTDYLGNDFKTVAIKNPYISIIGKRIFNSTNISLIYSIF